MRAEREWGELCLALWAVVRTLLLVYVTWEPQEGSEQRRDGS